MSISGNLKSVFPKVPAPRVEKAPRPHGLAVDTAAAFDQVVASSRAKISSQPTERKPSGLVTLQLATSPVHPICRPSIVRELAEVSPQLLAAMREVVAGKKPWPLFLSGSVGGGKTCAALALLDYVGGEYHSTSGLCARVIQSQQGRLEWNHEGRGVTLWPEKMWEMTRRARLVVLDELNSRAAVSEHHYECVWRLLEERVNRPLICISNFGLEDVAKVYDDRVASRIGAGTIVTLLAKDRRLNP